MAGPTVTPVDPTVEVERLRSKLERANRAYYELDSPDIPDSEYDRLFRRLQELEAAHPELATADSPTRRVGGAAAEYLPKAQHPVPMLSLDNAFNSDELRQWHARMVKVDSRAGTAPLALEVKIDGAALALTYLDGMLTRGVTRGDGRTGEEITANVRAINDIPLKLAGTGWPRQLEVRGEVYIPKAAFERLNTDRAKSGEPLLQNPRNAAAGALRSLDPAEAKRRRLAFFAYQLVVLDGAWPARSHLALLDLLEEWGFPVESHRQRIDTIDAAIAAGDEWQGRLATLGFGADGIVFKVNELALQEELGTAGERVPRWAIARKYPAEAARTRLLDIEVNIGRTGALAPSAILEPVHIGGALVSRATLHNEEVIAERDLRIGDLVEVIRSGEVIPKVIGPVVTARTGDEREWHPPSHCPFCDTRLVRPEGEVNLYCPNLRCPGRQFESLVHFVSRAGLDIDGLGPERIRQLLDEGLIDDAADLFDLNAESLAQLDGFATQSATALVAAIDTARTRPLESLLTALGVRHVGRVAARTLARQFGTMTHLRQATRDRLEKLEGIGPVIAGSLIAYFADPVNEVILDRLSLLGVAQEGANGNGNGGDRPLEGTIAVLTGSLPTLTRREATDLIEAAGGVVKSSVSKRTTLVVAGADPGEKRERAIALGVEVIDEAELLSRIETGK